MSYYECKRCFYQTKLKSDIKRHLNKLTKCDRTIDSYEYKDEDLEKLSLTLNNPIYKKEANLTEFCTFCNKIFSRKDSLNRHLEKFHKPKTTTLNNEKIENNEQKLENNETTIGNIHINGEVSTNSNLNALNGEENILGNSNIIGDANNIGDVINNNIYLINGFDKAWSTEHMDKCIKFFTILSKYKFTNLLSEVLKNDNNLNVLLNDETKNGLVYKNDDEQFVKMKETDIFSKSAEKLFFELKNIFNEFKDMSDYLDEDVIKLLNAKEQDTTKKYSNYLNKEDIKEGVNKNMKDLFNDKRDKTLKIMKGKNKLDLEDYDKDYVMKPEEYMHGF